jgi:FkbM family methyltransferase
VDAVQDFRAMLLRAAKRFTPSTIVDVGASDGRWSKMSRTVWPEAAIVLVEANPRFRPDLIRFCAEAGGRCRAEHALAGATAGSTNALFNTANPYQGVGILRADEMRASPTEDTATVPVIRLDDVTAASADVAPYLLKLDVHGHEAMIFEGAHEVLAQSCAVVVEVYLWEPCTHAPKMWELIPLLGRYGFRPTDLCEPLYRPSDGRLAQVDMLFERSDAPGIEKWW